MGKYIEKGKRKVEVEAAEEGMEVSPSLSPSSLGVRTRAKTKSLALKRLQKAKSKSKSKSKPAKSSPSSSSASDSSSSSAKSESCYLQLRSRRLEKSSATKPPKAASPKANPKKEKEEEEVNDAGIEVSFGENALETEGAGSRNSRETTPCSLIKRDSETIGTPGSTNRPTSSTANNRRIQSPTPSNFPYTREMEKFFAEPEERQQKEFAEKYNFDPVKDTPLPGRYEWGQTEKLEAAPIVQHCSLPGVFNRGRGVWWC